MLSPLLCWHPPVLPWVMGDANGHFLSQERLLSPLCTPCAKFPSSLESRSSSCLSEVLTRCFQAGSDEIKAAQASVFVSKPTWDPSGPHHLLTSVFITALHAQCWTSKQDKAARSSSCCLGRNHSQHCAFAPCSDTCQGPETLPGHDPGPWLFIPGF